MYNSILPHYTWECARWKYLRSGKFFSQVFRYVNFVSILFLFSCKDEFKEKYYFGVEKNDFGTLILDSFKVTSLEEGFAVSNSNRELVFNVEDKDIYYNKDKKSYIRFENDFKKLILNEFSKETMFLYSKKEDLPEWELLNKEEEQETIITPMDTTTAVYDTASVYIDTTSVYISE
jgi:hypothetical protein